MDRKNNVNNTNWGFNKKLLDLIKNSLEENNTLKSDIINVQLRRQRELYEEKLSRIMSFRNTEEAIKARTSILNILKEYKKSIGKERIEKVKKQLEQERISYEKRLNSLYNFNNENEENKNNQEIKHSNKNSENNINNNINTKIDISEEYKNEIDDILRRVKNIFYSGYSNTGQIYKYIEFKIESNKDIWNKETMDYFLKELSKILPDKDFQKADSIVKENLKEKKNNNREKYIEPEDLDADL